MKNKKEIIRCSTIEAWVKKMIVHHAQDRALNQVTEALDGSGTDDNLILLIGPAGIGKSTIRELLTKLIIDQEAKAMNDDLAYLPVVGIQVIKTPEKRSMWKALTKKTLIALGDPIPENKRVIDPKTGKTAMSQASHDNTTDGNLMAIINQFKERRTKLWIIDEAHHVLHAGMGRTELDNLETLKSICNETNTKCLLIGPYDLAKIVRNSGQLMRRSHEIHFPAYSNSEGAKYLNAARNMMAYLPIPVDAGIPDDLLTLGSLRCIGLLKGWLHRAALRARRRGLASISYDLLKETRYTARQLSVFAEAMTVGELLFHEDSAEEDELRRYLGVRVDKEEKPTAKPRKYLKPGDRNLTRDSIG